MVRLWKALGRWKCVQFVADTTQETLEELSVSIRSCEEFGIGVVSFKLFGHLKSLEIDVACLAGPSHDGLLHRAWISSGRAKWSLQGPNETPPIEEMLPPSIEVVSVRCKERPQYPDVLEKLFAGFSKEKWSETLPRLKSIEFVVGLREVGNKLFYRHDSRWSMMKQALESYGGTLLEEASDVYAQFYVAEAAEYILALADASDCKPIVQ